MKKKENILNETEIRLLKKLTTGLYIKEAGEQLGLSKYQVYKISKSIQTKLNAMNMTNAMFIAYKKSLIK